MHIRFYFIEVLVPAFFHTVGINVNYDRQSLNGFIYLYREIYSEINSMGNNFDIQILKNILPLFLPICARTAKQFIN